MTLTEHQKAWIVTQWARMRYANQIRKEFAEVFGVEIDRKQVHTYNPKAGSNYGRGQAKWHALFEEEREKFLAEVNAIPISNAAVRLDRLETMCVAAMEKGNAPLAASMIEQAAKEVGGLFTNRREIEGHLESKHKHSYEFSTEEARGMLGDFLANAVRAAQGVDSTKH